MVQPSAILIKINSNHFLMMNHPPYQNFAFNCNKATQSGQITLQWYIN